MFTGRSALLVAIGAVGGASVRWWTAEIVDPAGDWPWATFVVNVVGAFLLGIVLAASHRRVDEPDAEPIRLAVGTGFCGALTTFSTFAVEIATLGRDDRAGLAAGYLSVSLVVGVIAYVAGRSVETLVAAS